MTKARDLANLLDGNGDVNTANLDNVPASNDASALTTGTLPNARLPNNISDGGTTGTKVTVGTTAQRGSTTGQFRFNSTTGKFEGRNNNGFVTLEITPAVTSVDDAEVDSGGGGNQTFVITGTNFTNGDIASFIGTDASTFNASSTTVNSPTQITAVVAKSSFVNSKEPYDIKVATSGGLSGLLENVVSVDNSPTWGTSAGNLGTKAIGNTGTHFTLSATDADGDTIAYTVYSGSLPTGTSLNSSTGVISGTISGSASTFSFTVRATANTKTVDRSFQITTELTNYFGDGSDGSLNTTP